MIDIKRVIKQIKELPDSGVDCNFKQGVQAVINQLDYQVDEEFVAKQVVRLEAVIANLKGNAQPQKIPEEYIFFLEYYGGLYINNGERTHFITYGLGPMTEEWYPSVKSPDVIPEAVKYGFLPVGEVYLYDREPSGQYVSFFLDLRGEIQKQCIIAVGPTNEKELSTATIIKNIHSYPSTWRKVADSFTLWLKFAVETNGAFDLV